MWINITAMHFHGLSALPSDDSILTQGKSFASLWNEQWSNLLAKDDSLYVILTKFARFFAVSTLLFYLVQQFRDFIDGNIGRPIAAFIWPFLVAILLTHQGPLATITLATRNYMMGEEGSINSQMISQPVGQISLQDAYRVALDMTVAQETAGSFFRPCEGLIGIQQTNCLTEAAKKIETLRSAYKNTYPKDSLQLDQMNAYLDKLKTAAERSELQNSELSFNAVLGSTWQSATKGILLASQYAFQNLLEVTMLLVAMLGPIAVGASLLPVGGKPIWAWITGFLSLAIAKLSFNLIAGLAALLVYQSESADSTWFMIFVGVLAPLLALAIAAAGGFAVFSGISHSAAWAANQGRYYGGEY